MKILLVLLAFGAVALASREFVYEYKANSMTGIPHLKNQISGTGIRSKVIVQVESDNEYRIKMSEVSVGRAVNHQGPRSYESWRHGVELQYTPLTNKQGLEIPFKVTVRDGLVEGIETSPEEPIWVVNIKRALASQFSLNMNKIQRQRVFTEQNEIGQSSEEYFSVEEEPSVTGECRTFYTIVPLPEYIAKTEERDLNEDIKQKFQDRPAWIVTKTKDYNKCSKKPVFVHSSTVDDAEKGSNPSDAQHKRFSSRTSVSRFLIRGQPMHKYVVERVWTEGEYIVRPFATNAESIFVVSNQTLVLMKEQSSSSPLPIPSQLESKSLLFQVVSRSEEQETELKRWSWKSGQQSRWEQESLESQLWNSGRRSREEFETEHEYQQYKQRQQRHEEQQWGRRFSRMNPESFEYPKLTEAPKMMFATGQQVPVEKVKQQIKELIHKTEEEVESLQDTKKEELPMNVLKISRALTVLNYQEIKELYREIVGEQEQWGSHQQRYGSSSMSQKTKRDVLLDAIAMCGTNPCVMWLKELIEKKEVRGEKAAGLLMVLPATVKTPTPELLRELVELTKSVKSHSQQNEQVWFTALLSTSTLINRACVDKWSRRHNYGSSIFTNQPYCSESEAELFLPYLKEELKQTTKTSQLVTLVQSIGNLGTYGAYQALRPIVSGRAESKQQIRSKAIILLGRIAERSQRHLQKEIFGLLKPIFNSPVEKDEVRMSAFVSLLNTQPDESFYTEVATSTWFEPSQQVGQFVYSTLENMANCTYPTHFNFTVKASMALPMAKKFNLGLHYSRNSIFSHVIPERHIGSTLQIARFGGKHSLVPEQIFVELKNIMGGFDSPLFRIGVQSQGIQELINRFLGPQKRQELDTGLNIHTRKDKDFQGNVWVQLMGSMERVITLDTLRDWAREGIVEYTGEKEYRINYQKTIPLEESTIVLPIESGLPTYIVRKTPMFISFRGTVEFDMDVKKLNARMMELPNEAKMILKLKPIIAMTRLIEAGVSSPLTKEVFLTGHISNALLNIPGKLEVIYKNKELEIIAEKHQNLPSKLELLSYKSFPFTAQGEVFNFVTKNMKRITTQDELQEVKMANLGEKTFGLNLELIGKVDSPYMNFGGLYELLHKYNLLTATTFLFVRDHSLREVEYKVKLDLSKSETQRMKIKIAYNKEHENVAFDSFNEEERLLSKYYKQRSHQLKHMKSGFESLLKNPRKLFEKEQEEEEEYGRYARPYNLRSSEERRMMEGEEFQVETSAVLRSLHAELVCEGRQTRKFRSSSIHTVSSSSLKHKMTFLFERESSSSSSEYIIHATGHIQWPRLPIQRTQMYSTPKTTVGHIAIKYGRGSTPENEVQAKIVLDQSQEWLREIERSPVAKECSKFEQRDAPYVPICLEARREASTLNKAVVEIDGKSASNGFWNGTWHIDDFLKAQYYPYMTNKRLHVSNPEKQIKMVFDFKPKKSKKRPWLVLDSFILKPRENTFFQKVKLNKLLELVLPLNVETPLTISTLNKAFGYQYVPVCEVQRELITTFDNVTYKYPIDGCYHLVAKDCSKKIPVQVLAKEVSGGKWVRLEVDDIKAEITPDLEVEVGGRKIRPSLDKEEVVRNSEGRKVLVVKMIKQGKLILSAPIHRVKILADGKNFQVQMSNMYRGRVCGLCGDMNGEKVAEMKDPQGCVRNSVKRFAESYIVEGCSERRRSQQLDESECQREQEIFPRGSHSRRNNQQWEGRRSESGIRYTNKVLERNSRTCFSIKPVTECRVGTKPSRHITKQIGFHCIQRGRMATEMIARARFGVLEELFEKEADFFELVSMPENCESIRKESEESSRGYGHRAL